MKLSRLDGTQEKQEKNLADSSKFFDNMFSSIDKMLERDDNNSSKKNYSEEAKEANKSYLERNKKNNNELIVLQKIHKNTDTIIELLKNNPLEKEKKGFDLSDLLKFLLPGLALLPGLISPDNYKPIPTILKAAPKILKGGAKATSLIADAAQTAGKGTKYLGSLGSAGKVLGSIGGKLSDSPLMNKVIRYSSIGMMGGRALQGDYTGAAGEGASLAFHEAARKAKSPKTKAILTALSLGTDAGLIVRDFLRSDDEKQEDKKTENPSIVKNEEENQFYSGGSGGNPGGSSFGLGTAALIGAGLSVPLLSKITKGLPSTGLLPNKNMTSPIVDAAHIFKKTVLDSSSTLSKNLMNAGSGLLSKLNLNTMKSIPKVGAGLALGGSLLGAVGSKIFKNDTSTIVKDTPKVDKTLPKAGMIKNVAKFGGKILPGVGLAMGAAGAYSRASDGDYLGAAGEAVAGLASLVPGLGTAASLVIQSGLAYRDYVRETSENTGELNTITKDSTSKLGDLAEENGTIIKNTNDTLVKNSNDINSVISKTDKSLLSFVNVFGINIGKWLFNSSTLFNKAFTTLTEFSSSISSKIKDFASVAYNKFTQTGSDGAYTGTTDKKRLKTELGKGIISQTASGFGAVSAAFESGNRGVNTVSTGKGDHGGVSYGKHQMTADTITDFLNSKEGAGFKKEFTGLKAGTTEFSKKYRKVAFADGKNFEEAQKKYIDRTHYGVAARTLRDKHGLDLKKRGIALREAIYSTSVQYNPERTSRWVGAIVGKNADKMSDQQIIDALYNKKASTVESMFPRSSKEVRASIANRIATERQMLTNINKVNGGYQGNGSTGFVSAGLGQENNNAKTNTSSPTQGKKDNAKAGAKADWDLDKLCDVAVSRARKRKASGDCALYVRIALEKAQLTNLFSGGLGHAKDFTKSLPKIKWKPVGNNITSFKKGDIAVFPKTGSKKGRIYGHVAIFTGSVWVSDYIQSNIQPNRTLGNFPYTIWRAISGISNGTAVGADSSPDLGEDGQTQNGLGAESTGGDSLNPMDAAIEAATSGVANVVAAFGNSDIVKSALDFVNSAKVDDYVKREGSDGDTSGFSKIVGQQKDFNYKNPGNGLGINEDELFNPNLERQKAGSDILGQAGRIDGIVRQLPGQEILENAGRIDGIVRQLPGQDILGEAGKIDGIVRQLPGQDILGMAGSIGGIQRQGKPKKKKWYDFLFSGEYTGLFSDLAKALGLSEEFGLASEAYGVYNSGRDIGDWATEKATKKLETLINDPEKNRIGILSPDIESKNKVDGYITDTNIRYNEYKKNLNKSSSSAPSPAMTSLPNTSFSGKGNKNIDGMSAPLVTRNPDSIFRAVCISIMKSTTT